MTPNQRVIDAMNYTAACERQRQLNEKAGKTVPGQMFPRGTRVHINKELPPGMSHFESDCDAIIRFSYTEMFGGRDNRQTNTYSLLLLDENDVPYNTSAWYDAEHLTACENSVEDGFNLLNYYTGNQR